MNANLKVFLRAFAVNVLIAAMIFKILDIYVFINNIYPVLIGAAVALILFFIRKPRPSWKRYFAQLGICVFVMFSTEAFLFYSAPCDPYYQPEEEFQPGIDPFGPKSCSDDELKDYQRRQLACAWFYLVLFAVPVVAAKKIEESAPAVVS